MGDFNNGDLFSTNYCLRMSHYRNVQRLRYVDITCDTQNMDATTKNTHPVQKLCRSSRIASRRAHLSMPTSSREGHVLCRALSVCLYTVTLHSDGK